MNARTPARRPQTRGALIVLTGMLAASGLIRLGDGTGLALAQKIGGLDARAGPGVEPQACTPPPEVAKVLDALGERSDRLDSTERALDARERSLAVAADAVARNMKKLKAAEAELDAKLAEADEAAEGDLSTLTAVYENMKPQQASALFEEMAPDFAAGFLARMKPPVAAEVLAGLQPQTAYTISAILAGRNADVPSQ